MQTSYTRSEGRKTRDQPRNGKTVWYDYLALHVNESEVKVQQYQQNPNMLTNCFESLVDHAIIEV